MFLNGFDAGLHAAKLRGLHAAELHRLAKRRRQSHKLDWLDWA
jgi:hypothetical protein